MGFRIGECELRHGLLLAPMAGYTDRAMRLVCHRMGAEYSVSEMVSAKAVVFGDKKTLSLAKILEDEGKVAIQLFGSEPSVMAEATGLILERGLGVMPVAIDINMGCPVNKIFSNGEGSALMRSPELIEKITAAAKSATTLPVTVKLRSGIDSSHINAVECALAAESGGASAVCIHGRTRVQMYGGYADRGIIKEVKSALKIPVIANGDILTGSDAVSMLKDTGADGITIGRGAVGNPFIFSEITAALEGRDYTPPTLDEKISTAILQLTLAAEDKGERAAIPEARKQIALYLRSFRGAAAIRKEINSATTLDEAVRALMMAKEYEVYENETC